MSIEEIILADIKLRIIELQRTQKIFENLVTAQGKEAKKMKVKFRSSSEEEGGKEMKTIVPYECYQQYGNDLDGCSRQEMQGCKGCTCLIAEKDKTNEAIIGAKCSGGMTFGLAIKALKNGYRVARQGWNGKGMFLYFVAGRMVDRENTRNEASIQPIFDDTGVAHFNSHIDMKTADGSVCVGWLASQADMLAEDWMIIE